MTDERACHAANCAHPVRVRSDRGSATIWMIAVTACAFMMIGLVLDGGVMLRTRSDAFSIAASAARVGAQQLEADSAVEGEAVLDPVAAELAALDYLAVRGFTGTVTASADTVTVTVQATALLQLLQVVDDDIAHFEATASARAVKVEP